uniref:Uncharacterized protein n=1 Tax=Mycena chlorophos TaxID=658473 RepID=A0ABQ0LM27_MYCCL|nr:predicted protein [Mycena chlorophos]
MISAPDTRFLSLCEDFGIALKKHNSSIVDLLTNDFRRNAKNTARLQKILDEERDGKLGSDIAVKDYTTNELKQMNRDALERLGNPAIL